jgi:Zinc carboxypeptidase
MKKSSPVVFAGIALLLLGPASVQPISQAPTPGSIDLIGMFGPRGIVRDSNDDGLADSVAARVVVPALPALEDSAAAINIAGRLGFETTSMTLPIVWRDNALPQAASIELPILVGRSNRFVRALIDRGELSVADLQPGQGIITVARSPLGGADGLIVVGGDDKGTLAAANVLAARLPRLWNMSGITLAGLSDQVTRYLSARGVSARSSVQSIVVDSDRRGLARVHVRAAVAANAAGRAQQALEELDRLHRRGLEPQTLNFAEIARTSVEIWADNRAAGKTDVLRAGLNSRTLTPPIDPNELATDSPGDRGRPADGAPAAQAGRTFDLSNPYTIGGWFGDSYSDLIPDRTETTLVVSDASEALSAAHIAARLGLETTGVTLPLARPVDDVREPAREQNPILVGRDNRLVQDLVKIGRADLGDLQPGDGVIQVVPRAFGGVTATVVAGADPAGTEAASSYLARHVPYVWDTRRGALSIADVKTELARFLGARSGAGQASQALVELEAIARELSLREGGVAALEGVDVKVFLEQADAGFDAFLTTQLGKTLSPAKIVVKSEAITAPTPVIDETLEIPWEVDEFWKRVRADVLPAVQPGATVEIEARLSESPEYRRTIADQLKAELIKAGASNPAIRIQSAYKQGYLWLTEQVIPELKGKGARTIQIKAAEYKPDLTKKYKFYQVPSRWVHELYPVDDIFQRELGIAKESFSLELADSPKEIYTLDALDGGGRIVYSASFSPKFVEREYMDKFPGWSRVDVTTGWLMARVNGKTAVDARIQTDPERFWDQYQAKILPRIYDHVMRVTNNQPLPDKQPFHRDLDVEVRMSEPDFRIGVDEELISSLESLHEDLYFVTLDFFDALGRTTTRRRLAAPGKIFPIIHPERRGQPGQVRVLYAGNAAPRAQLEVRVSAKGGAKPETIRRDLTRIEASAPQALRAVVRQDAVNELALVVDARDDREAARAADALDALGRLHAASLYKTALSYERVNRLAVDITLRDARTRRLVRSTGAAAPSNVLTAANKPRHPAVTWDHVIGPDESEQIVGALAAYPEVKAYKAGSSYRGRSISVMEITLPVPGELVSLAKLTALKPTILITGRQHANEVSSTSHILRLGELLATDKSYRDILKRVNIILHPVENPDGAQMAYDLQKLTPTHMLHAGRYSALGMDVASQVGLADPLLPEALVRGRLWQDWLPDIYLNPHGYPSHEWVQQFAGYVPPGFRSYLSTRGWYTQVTGLRDPRYPEHADAVSAIREAVVREINSNPDVRDMNLRSQARYRRWAYGFAPYVYSQEIYKDTAIYYSDMETGEPRGSRRAGGAQGGGGGGGRFSMNQWPQVTFMSGMTESPDETAQGAWLDLATKPGFSFLMAHVKYLRDGRYGIERIEEDGQRESTSRTLLRVRPVRPPAPTAYTNGARQ